MAYQYSTLPLLKHRIIRFTNFVWDKQELGRLYEVLAAGRSLVWFIYEMHNCPKVHDHAYYVMRASTEGISREEYTEGDFYRVIFLFNDSTRDILWDWLQQNFDECYEEFKEMTEKEFWDNFQDIHPVNIGSVCAAKCTTVLGGIASGTNKCQIK